jgi:hypothetical protein
VSHSACVVCGSVDDVHHHPLVGNSVEPWNLITLCEGCRAKLMSSSIKPKRRPARKSRDGSKPSRRSALASAGAPPAAVVPSDADPRSSSLPAELALTTLAFNVALGFFVFALQWRPFIILAGVCRAVGRLCWVCRQCSRIRARLVWSGLLRGRAAIGGGSMH